MIATSVATRTCTRCHQTFPLSHYSSNGKGGIRSKCRACNTAQNALWRERVMAETDGSTQRCARCHVEKALNAYGVNATTGALKYTCNDCLRHRRQVERPNAPRRMLFAQNIYAAPEVVEIAMAPVTRCPRCGSRSLFPDREDGGCYCMPCGWYSLSHRIA